MSIVGQGKCSHKAGTEDSVTITEEDNGREVSIAKSGTLIVRLEAKPGTGYAWQVVQNDSHYLKAQGESTAEGPESDQPGSTEHQVFRFTAQASGSSILKLHYARAWEKGVAPSKTFSVKVNIR